MPTPDDPEETTKPTSSRCDPPIVRRRVLLDSPYAYASRPVADCLFASLRLASLLAASLRMCRQYNVVEFANFKHKKDKS